MQTAIKTETAQKVLARYIIIHRAEGYQFECQPVLAEDWAGANLILGRMSHTAPDSGGYDKIDFTIVWRDGEVYQGTYDLKHPSVQIADLSKHVRDFIEWNAGLAKSPHCGAEKYAAWMAAQPADDAEKFVSYLEKYQIGDDSGRR